MATRDVQKDVQSRLEGNGFRVRWIPVADLASPSDVERLGLGADKGVFFCLKG